MVRLQIVLATFTIAAMTVSAVNLYEKGSHLHVADTAQSSPHVEREPTWAHVTQTRTAQAFYKGIASQTVALVYFYAPWSQPSLAMAADIDQEAAKMAKMRPAVAVFAVNVVDVPELGREYRVNSLPNFAVFRFGMLAPRNEQLVPRYPPSIPSYMQSLMKDAVTRLETTEAAKELVDVRTKMPIAKIKGIGLHPDDQIAKSVAICFTDDEELIASVHDASRLLAGFFAVYLADAPKTRKLLNADVDTCVVYRSWGTREPVTFTLNSGTTGLGAQLARWLVHVAIAPMAVFDEDSKPLYAMRHKPLLIYFAPARLPSSDPLYRILETLGDDEALNVTTTQCNPNTAGRMVAHFLGMDDSLRHHRYAVGLLVGRKKFRFDIDTHEPTLDNLRAFVLNATAGRIPQHFKSEGHSVIYPHGSGRVSELAYADFEANILNNATHDALILFYRPDDHNSQLVMPVLDEVATRLKDTSIVIGRYNLLENDYHDTYAVPGVPVILYATRTNKRHPVKMGGVARTADNIEAFAAEHATVSLSAMTPSNQTPSSPRLPISQAPPPNEDL